jgi:hypothetical protein
MISRYVYAAGCTACLALFAACEHHPGAAAPGVTPSPAAHTAAAATAVLAPARDIQRASAQLAGAVTGWNQPKAAVPTREPQRTDAATLAAASSAKDLAAATAALNAALQGANAPARQSPPE